jgi:TolB-like protein
MDIEVVHDQVNAARVAVTPSDPLQGPHERGPLAICAGEGEAPSSERLDDAGLRVLLDSASSGELDVVLTQLYRVTTVAVQRDGEEIERFTVDWDGLPCSRTWSNNFVCFAREIAARVVESKAVASAMEREAKPAATAAPATTGRPLTGKLAVLDLRNFTKDLTRENAQYFTDVVRSAALQAQPQLEVMTRENLIVLLQASGKDLANCEGECEVDTGRRIGADQIVSGEIQRLGTMYKITLRLHDTRAGRLLSSTQASGKTIEELDANAQKAAIDLLTAH